MLWYVFLVLNEVGTGGPTNVRTLSVLDSNPIATIQQNSDHIHDVIGIFHPYCEF